ncbi:MAG: carboxypeptidase-like regulatory domain-containing protein, partial [Flavisolibacter sp.]|nr:carboxypeptidase-like regulatory domain-containing protein [Flavisolibacter sp.]
MKDCLLYLKNSSSRKGNWKKPLIRCIQLLCFLFFTVTSTSLFAQNVVSGRVVSNDTAVVGATVQVKGTNVATQTDANGHFTINAPASAT